MRFLNGLTLRQASDMLVNFKNKTGQRALGDLTLTQASDLLVGIKNNATRRQRALGDLTLTQASDILVGIKNNAMRRQKALAGYRPLGDLTIPEASDIVVDFKNEIAAQKQAASFKNWLNMYALPYAEKLYSNPYSVMREEQLLTKPDAGVSAVTEVAKITDKLAQVKQTQGELVKEVKKKVVEGDKAAVAELVKAGKVLEKKSDAIKTQLADRVTEGVDLAKAKALKEKNRAEVLRKRMGQALAAPSLAEAWKKHDAMYETYRAKVVAKHDQDEMKAAGIKSQLSQLPKGHDKDAKMERFRKQEAKRRLDQEIQLATLDASEAGKLDARAKLEGLKKI